MEFSVVNFFTVYRRGRWFLVIGSEDSDPEIKAATYEELVIKIGKSYEVMEAYREGNLEFSDIIDSETQDEIQLLLNEFIANDGVVSLKEIEDYN